MDKIFKAMSDINRRKILTLLKNKEMTVSELLKYFDIGQATISNHLSILKKAKLVNLRIEVKNHFYSINWVILNRFVKELNIFVDFVNSDEIIMRR